MSLEKILKTGRNLLMATFLSASLTSLSPAQNPPEEAMIPIPVDQSLSWFRPINGVLTCKNKSNTTSPSAQFASQYTVTNTFYLTGKTTEDGCLNVGFFSADPRKKPEKTHYRIDYANSKLYIMCSPNLSIDSNTQYAEELTLTDKLASTKLVPKEEAKGFWIRAEQRVLETLENYDPSRKFLEVYTLGTATDYCFSELIKNHAIAMNTTVGERMKNEIDDRNAIGTIQIPFHSKEKNVLFRNEFGRKFRIFLGAQNPTTPVRVLYHIETEFDDGTSSARGTLEAFTEEFPAFTIPKENPPSEQKPSTQKWPTGIWIKEPRTDKTVTPEKLESQELYQAGYCIDNDGNLYQIYSSRRFPAFTETRQDGTIAVYHKDVSNGVKITERNNSSLEILRPLNVDTMEQTTTDTSTGTTIRRNIFKRK
jgi:hypothetical protein